MGFWGWRLVGVISEAVMAGEFERITAVTADLSSPTDTSFRLPETLVTPYLGDVASGSRWRDGSRLEIRVVAGAKKEAVRYA
jgi:hypothetical protein